jgi:hypothetical protein
VNVKLWERSVSNLEAFAGRWLQSTPALALSLQFARRAEREHWLVCAILAFELMEAAFALSEERIARTKLAWWLEEASLSVRSEARHPLTQALDIEGADLNVLPDLVRALIDWLDAATAPDATAQLAQFAGFAAPLARLCLSGPASQYSYETYGNAVQRAWEILALSYQLRCLREPNRFGPCALTGQSLAQHQLRRAQLHAGEATPAIVAQLDWLQRRAEHQAAGLPALGALVSSHLAQVQRGKPARAWGRWRELFAAWRAARRALRV